MAKKSQFLLFPPPPRTTDRPILAIVVEKTGDETRTSMKQDEIFCFSPWIRIRDGYMIISKIHWNHYNPGDWILCDPMYALDKCGELADEKGLTNLRKVDPVDFKRCLIPPTHVFNGNVRIVCLFTPCPKFIRNKETQNRRYKKLYLLNIGQGFYNSDNPDFNMLRDRPYYGVFEFRGKDNGAVNFTRRSEMLDNMDRDAMWELVEVVKTKVSKEDVNNLNQTLSKLKNQAIEYHRELRQQRAESKKTLESDAKMTAPKEKTLQKSDHPPKEINENDDWNVCINRVIVHGQYPNQKGKLEATWRDLETGEMTKNVDLLRFKYCARHGISDDSVSTTVQEVRQPPPSVTQRGQEHDETALSDIVRKDNNANPSTRVIGLRG